MKRGRKIIKFIPYGSAYIPPEATGKPTSDKNVLSIFGQRDALVFPISKSVYDVEKSEKENLASEGIVNKYCKPFQNRLEQEIQEGLDSHGEVMIAECRTFSKGFANEEVIIRSNNSEIAECIAEQLRNHKVIIELKGSFKPLKFKDNERVKTVMIDVRQDIPTNEIKSDIQSALESLVDFI